MRVGLLGPLEIEHEGEAVAVGGGRLRALLARLALDAGRPVTTGALVEAVWEDELPADHVHALQSLVSRLRRALGDAALVAPAPGGYRLEAQTDVQEFEREGALELWRGPALADLRGYRFAQLAAERLEEQRVAALIATGDLPTLEALHAEHPLHERLAARLIGALFAAGRQADALAVYERTRRRLDDELGVAPSPELQQAHLAVVQGERKTRRTNLPAPVTSFVGREAELERIDELLDRARLITLLGPGGAGKTRLAREAVARHVDDVADGVWMVELAPITDESEIVGAVVGALGLREAVLPGMAPRDSLPRLLDVLAERETIVVLDNCEHVIAGAADLADRLLASCPRLKVVATSREALAIDGEALVPVPPLAESPAVTLFADRAAAARPGYVIDEAGREICRRLDGLPLALELAAARLRTLTAGELAERLDDRFRVLTGGSRTALPRHRTLRAVVDWSWELLDDPERVLARRIALFTAGATVASASAVYGADAFDGLAALAERSLVQVVPDSEPTRYRMLETIREYGLEKLEAAGELESTRGAHARYFAKLVAEAEPRLRGPEQARWFALVDAEREHVLTALRHFGELPDARAAVALAVDLLWVWVLSGSQQEALTWTRFAAAVPGDADPEDRAILEGMLAIAALEDHPDQPGAEATLKALHERALPLDDRRRPLVALAKVMLEMFAAPEERACEAAALAHPDPWVRATVRLFLSVRAENEGDIALMGEQLTAAREQLEALGDRWALGMALFFESGRLILIADLEGAEAVLEEVREALSALSPDAITGMLDIRIADIRTRRGDLDGARFHITRARERRDVGRDDLAFIQSMEARIEWLAGDIDAAAAVLEDALERLGRAPLTMPQAQHGHALLHSISASVAAERGDFEAADRHFAAAYAAGAGTKDMPMLAAVAVAGATVAAARGERVAAAELLAAATAIRGAEDPTNPEITRLDVGIAPPVTRADALAALEAAGSRAAPIAP
ncbi:winged helix-turn-helix domain-containing protein [Solirubrobacter sp. CPCC 204708]|uniref:NB-ARC domain-containing protein n=1 Tax=Solirubrobacter deserti TaxID=2282478 RepID=A0ABT4REW9_9ACTN|nr:BTAD domain-containing putative transcriptional regulator [Solirubrobacter deserti]MBE2318636.1 winged helix-turn-helix domain-containing protein [Solirubrobacter deserti]MDA0137094.1 NB-ARC domain-containing protein [Solirubrobacter deserti]